MYLQRWHGWCHKKLLPSRRVPCTPYNHARSHFMQSHMRKVYACLAVTCHLRFWQNDRGLSRATAVTRGGTDTEIRVSTESWSWRRKLSRRSSRYSNPRPFDHESGALTTELSPPPRVSRVYWSPHGSVMCLRGRFLFCFVAVVFSRPIKIPLLPDTLGSSYVLMMNVCMGRMTPVWEGWPMDLCPLNLLTSYGGGSDWYYY